MLRLTSLDTSTNVSVKCEKMSNSVFYQTELFSNAWMWTYWTSNIPDFVKILLTRFNTTHITVDNFYMFSDKYLQMLNDLYFFTVFQSELTLNNGRTESVLSFLSSTYFFFFALLADRFFFLVAESVVSPSSSPEFLISLWSVEVFIVTGSEFILESNAIIFCSF